MASVASNGGACAPDPLALAASASRARAVAVGLRCFVPGMGSRDAGEAIGHGNIHADNRDVSVDFGPLGKRTRDVERHVGGRGENGVGDELRVLAGQADGAGKAGGGVEPHFAGGADRAGVRRRSCEMINSDRASVRDECPGHSGQLESRLIVAEFAAAQAEPFLAPAVLQSSRAAEARPRANRRRDDRTRRAWNWRGGHRGRRRSSRPARPSGASGAEPVRRTALPVPALIVTSSEVRPPESRPEPATSSAGKPALRICGATTRCRRMRHSPVGLLGVPPIVASPSAMPDRPRPGENKSSAVSGRPAAFAFSASVDPLCPESDSRPAPTWNPRSLMSRPLAP